MRLLPPSSLVALLPTLRKGLASKFKSRNFWMFRQLPTYKRKGCRAINNFTFLGPLTPVLKRPCRMGLAKWAIKAIGYVP